MKKWLWIALIIVVVAIIGAGMNKGKDTTNIKVGATLSLTGSLASIGKSEMIARLAI
jgi:hypothetical protein